MSGRVCTLLGMGKVKMIPLAEGAVARLYRDGTLLACVDVPIGRMELRNLQPGQYEARDEIGGRAVFEVGYESEVVIVQDPDRKESGPVVAADSTRQLDREPEPAVPEPIYPAKGKHGRIKEADPEWRVPAPVDDGVRVEYVEGETLGAPPEDRDAA